MIGVWGRRGARWRKEEMHTEDPAAGGSRTAWVTEEYRRPERRPVRLPPFSAWVFLVAAAGVGAALSWYESRARRAPRPSSSTTAVTVAVDEPHSQGHELPATKPVLPTTRLGDLTVLTREAWGASDLQGNTEELGKPTRITIHHFGDRTVEFEDRDHTARLVRGVQRNHQRERGWVDIGYHYIVDRAGRFWEGRPAKLVGAHAGPGTANHGNIGVLVLGNFDHQRLPGAQERALQDFVEELRKIHGVARTEVLGHQQVRALHGLGATDCPGRGLTSWLERYRGTPADSLVSTPHESEASG